MERVDLQSDIVVDDQLLRRFTRATFRGWLAGPIWLIEGCWIVVGLGAAVLPRDAAGPFVVTCAAALLATPFIVYFSIRHRLRTNFTGRTLAVGFGETAFAVGGSAIRSTIQYGHVKRVRQRGGLVEVDLHDGQKFLLPSELVTDARLALLTGAP